MEGHILRWDAFEQWAHSQGINVYPPTEQMVVRYLLNREAEGCGPTVPDGIRSSVAWICRKLDMACPAIGSETILAIRDRVITAQGKPTREAETFTFEQVGNLEQMVFSTDQTKALISWWILCLICIPEVR